MFPRPNAMSLTPPRIVAMKRELQGLQTLALNGEATSHHLRQIGHLEFDIRRHQSMM